MTQMMTYHRPDGVTGCGFVIEWGGLQQHSVSWPDGPAQRYRDEDLADRQITVRQAVDAHSDPENVVEPHPLESSPATADAPLPLDPIPEPGEPVSIAPFDATATEAANIRIALEDNPEATNRQVIDRLHAVGIDVSSSQVTRERKALAKLAEAAASEAATEQSELQVDNQ